MEDLESGNLSYAIVGEFFIRSEKKIQKRR